MMMLNSLLDKPVLGEKQLVDEAIAGKHVDSEKLSTIGIDLDQFTSNLEAAVKLHLSCSVVKYRADEGRQSELNEAIDAALKDPNSRVGLNY